MARKRIQLTLFIDQLHSESIENIRRQFNPKQFELIKSHVTLCREDELEQIDTILQTLTELNHPKINIHFGAVKRFENGNGVLIPALGNNNQFQELRKIVLRKIKETPRSHEPHITLMHPRNSVCTDEIFDNILEIILPVKLNFQKISLIEQEDENAWKVIQEFDLSKHSEHMLQI